MLIVRAATPFVGLSLRVRLLASLLDDGAEDLSTSSTRSFSSFSSAFFRLFAMRPACRLCWMSTFGFVGAPELWLCQNANGLLVLWLREPGRGGGGGGGLPLSSDGAGADLRGGSGGMTGCAGAAGVDFVRSAAGDVGVEDASWVLARLMKGLVLELAAIDAAGFGGTAGGPGESSIKLPSRDVFRECAAASDGAAFGGRGGEVF